MGNQVYANNMEISCKAADGKAVCAFPDVCFTPPQTPATPPGVPIPYPNTAMASDCTDGSKTVQISGQELMLKDESYFKQSTGDEAGSAPKKGVITSTNKGKVYFNAWSMDVKAEGQNVVRHLDLTTHNHASQTGQTPPWPYMDAMAASKDPCKTEKANEEAACKDYEPNGAKDACKDAGLGNPLIQKDVDAQAAGFPNAAAWADDAAKKAAADNPAAKCVQARRCKLVPYDAEKDGKNGCCPSQTPDHVIPKSSFFKDSFVEKPKPSDRVDGWPKYDYKKAPCMCAEGASNTAGSHGLRHAHHKANGPGKDVMQSFNKEADLCSQGAAEVFKPSGCTEECIKQQLKNGHKDMGDQRKTVKHSPSGSDMTPGEVTAKVAQLSPTTVAE
jgi:hypothetical protein